MEYPTNWEKLFEEHQKDIKAGNFVTYNPKDPGNKKRTFGIVFKVPPTISTKIQEVFDEVIPLELRSKLIFQPADGFHFTIQWTPEKNLTSLNVDGLITNLGQLLKDAPPIHGDLYLQFFGRAGLYGMLKTKTDSEIGEIRKNVDQIWNNSGLQPGLNPKDYDLAYISLVRYLEKFSPEEVRQFQQIPIQKIPNVELSEVWVVLNDKFMSPENTQVIAKILLHVRR